MRTILRWTGVALGSVLLLIAVTIGVAWWRSNAALAEVHPSMQARIDWSAGDPQRGEHLAKTRGCTDCHGADLAGAVNIDSPPFGTLVASNLTPAEREPGYYQTHLVNVLRGGIGSDGRSLVFMPSMDYMTMADTEVADLAAYLEQLPPVVNPALPAMSPGVLPRVLWLFGRFPLVSRDHIDSSIQPPASVLAEASAAYGEHIVAMCKGCHGAGLAGLTHGLAPGTPPPSNLTPAGGMGEWTEQGFITAMRTGVRPDGTQLDEFMPWRTLARMTDTELRAMWLYLRTLPARELGENG